MRSNAHFCRTAADDWWVHTDVAERKAGSSPRTAATTRYRAWLRRVWWALPLVALPMVAILEG